MLVSHFPAVVIFGGVKLGGLASNLICWRALLVSCPASSSSLPK